ncbi:uncharacterized protein LOC109812789 [Cajanus cajan]|uniref:Hydroxyproline-rich glycoprotein family protein n=1 Tax=Cajanus cajan TaxID=3821 RepID=A0A151U6R4_CAJCA|nr:uncharacterized protein LOC109812789 [Cajanus cajan]KYP74968.1 hypothetical protein KK1_007664 [Cajanus cajan]
MNETEKKKKHVIREPPSVPFIWEVKPGTPKKDWKPEVPSLGHFPKTPLKLIASIPFVWEEKPGIPLPNVSHVSVPPKPEKMLIHVASSSGFSFPCNFGHDDAKDKGSKTSLDLEAFSFDADETSEAESSTSSYATGRSSPVGATFLECLFPLYPPKSGFLQRDDEHMEKFTSSSQELRAEDFEHDGDCGSDLVTRPPTLGELIMMSRRRSCRRKAVLMKKWDPPQKITRKQAFGCFSSVTNSNMIDGLLKRKYFPRLKLV